MNIILLLMGVSTWCVLMIGLLSKIVNTHQRDSLQNKLYELELELRSDMVSPPDTIPDHIQQLMKTSPNHDEVQEIEASDTLIGVFFDNPQTYPPEFDD